MKRANRMLPIILLVGLALAVAGPAWADEEDSLVGDYNGGQMEVAAGLRLSADGHFMYALSYGALDEQAEGSWQRDGDCAVLTSEPVTPPEFRVAQSDAIAARELRIALQAPGGISPQYFDYTLIMADGSERIEQMQDDGVIAELADGEVARAVVLTLPLFDLRSQPFDFPETGGLDLVVAFDPNDLGKVAFAAERLCPEKQGLRLDRYGLELHFRKLQSEG